jgi:hypothetical protein
MLLTGAPSYWWWRKVGGKWDQALPLYEPRLLIIDHLGEVSIIKPELLNLYPKLSHRAHIDPGTTDNSLTCPICQPSSNGTNHHFQLGIFSGVLNIRQSDWGASNRIQVLQHLVLADLFCKMVHRATDTQTVYLQVHLLMPTDNHGVQLLVSELLRPSSTCYRTILAKESLWIQLPPWTFSLPPK